MTDQFFFKAATNYLKIFYETQTFVQKSLWPNLNSFSLILIDIKRLIQREIICEAEYAVVQNMLLLSVFMFLCKPFNF